MSGQQTAISQTSFEFEEPPTPAFTASLADRATDPRHSAVVAACAGSGKTWMLITRIFRLLLAGASPDGILAITFTRKAAQEMSHRLDELLQTCALCTDTELKAVLAERGCSSDEATVAAARGLAARVYQSPRGVEMNTFHGWFTALCQMAPLSIGFSRQAEPTELAGYWRDLAWQTWVAAMESAPSGHQDAQRFRALLAEIGAFKTRSALMALADQRAAWLVWSNGQTQADLLQILSEGFEADVAQNFPAAFFKDAQAQQILFTVAGAWGKGTATECSRANELECAWTNADWDALTSVLRTGKGTRSVGKLAKAALAAFGGADAQERFLALWEALQEKYEQVTARMEDLHWFKVTSMALQLLPSYLAEYERLKSAAGVVDFDDLELTAFQLLSREDTAPYLQARLDRRTQHVLIDEFQDTNPVQWMILQQWLSSYHQGDGPTVFMVGDPKQSIYRFRRAEAGLFEHARAWFELHFNARFLETNVSRRCAGEVLDSVNDVFVTRAALRPGRTPILAHEGIYRASGAGLFVFPLVCAVAGRNSEVRTGWLHQPRVKSGAQGDAGNEEAQRLAVQVQHWLETGEIASPGDVMVLVRRHADALPLSAALQNLGIAHSVNDKGGRFASLMWSDSIALLRVLFSRLNTTALLQLLRSPFFCIPVEELADFLPHLQAAGGAKAALVEWGAAVEQASASIRQAWLRIEQWRQWAQDLPLHDALDAIFRQTDIVARTLEMAPKTEQKMAQGHWDWMLNWALGIQQGRFPNAVEALREAARLSLHGTASASGDEVAPELLRIMTIHSAKGLEAKVVCLFNANSAAAGDRNSEMKCLVAWPVGQDVPEQLSLYQGKNKVGHARRVWFELENQASKDEADHLLYVAMTRAKARLYVSGCGEEGKAPVEGSWYARLSALASAQALDWVDADAQAGGANAPDAVMERELAPPATTSAAQVKWTTSAAVPVFETQVGAYMPDTQTAFTLRGEAWHACLEQLTLLAWDDFDDWWQQIQTPCADVLSEVDDETVAAIQESLRGLLANPALSVWLDDRLADEAHNEIEWMNAKGKLMRADRIVRKDRQWWVIDYKWSWSDDVLPDYVAQLRGYAQAVAATFTAELPVRALLLNSQGEIHEPLI
ncbi:MAG: UvrD-helicase domain-containing protein [Burkholderiales bacterium]|nr:UvrD-helicase domain-containing protein [Burkholderiales bacterium]